MRQMDDNLIVRIATIQAISMSLLFTATWLHLQGQHRITVSFLWESAKTALNFIGLVMFIIYLITFASELCWNSAKTKRHQTQFNSVQSSYH